MLLLGCLAGLGFSLSGLFTGRRPRPARPAAAERALHELRAGDIVQHGSSFLGVRRTLQLAAAGRWRTLSELEAEGAALGAPLLLVGAEAAGEPDAAWLVYPLPETRADLLATPQAPATESLPHDGLRYRLLSRHHTAVRVAPAAESAADLAPHLSLLCYRGPGAHRLLVTRFGGAEQAMGARLYVGERVLGESLTVLAGSR